jgi:hypothetical protein
MLAFGLMLVTIAAAIAQPDPSADVEASELRSALDDLRAQDEERLLVVTSGTHAHEAVETTLRGERNDELTHIRVGSVSRAHTVLWRELQRPEKACALLVTGREDALRVDRYGFCVYERQSTHAGSGLPPPPARPVAGITIGAGIPSGLGPSLKLYAPVAVEMGFGIIPPIRFEAYARVGWTIPLGPTHRGGRRRTTLLMPLVGYANAEDLWSGGAHAVSFGVSFETHRFGRSWPSGHLSLYGGLDVWKEGEDIYPFPEFRVASGLSIY